MKKLDFDSKFNAQTEKCIVNQGLKDKINDENDSFDYVYSELAEDWKEFSASNKFDISFQNKINLAKKIMMLINNDEPIEDLIDKLLLDCSNFALFCDVVENIVQDFSPRGVELVKILSSNWKEYSVLSQKIYLIENRNKNFRLESSNATQQQPN